MDRISSRHERHKSVMKYFSRTTKGNRLKERKINGQRDREKEREGEREVFI